MNKPVTMFLLLLLVLPWPGAAQEQPAPESSQVEDPAKSEEGALGWVDSSHATLTDRVGDLARWMDGFFGEPQSDIEAAYSRLRVRLEHEWDQDDGNDLRVKLRGKLYLPAASKRLSIIFEDEDSGNSGEFESAGLSTDEERSVSLQLTVLDHLRQRIDLSVGAKSGPKGKLAGRYRTDQSLGERHRVRFSEELFWVGGDGFGTLTRFDLDRLLDEGRLVRWSNRALYAEESNGVEWSSRLGYRQRLDEKSALRVYGGLSGDTDPSEVVRAYTVGVAWRRNLFRPWFFLELEPKYEWRRDLLDDGQNGPRHGVAIFLLRFEIALNEREISSSPDPE